MVIASIAVGFACGFWIVPQKLEPSGTCRELVGSFDVVPAKDIRNNWHRLKGEHLGLSVSYQFKCLGQQDSGSRTNDYVVGTSKASDEEDAQQEKSTLGIFSHRYTIQNPNVDWGQESWVKMPESGFSSNASRLKWCGNANALTEGKQVHSSLVKSGLEQDTFLGNLLVQMYGKCGTLEDARAVFVGMHERNVFSWAIMIGVCVQHGQEKEALGLFQEMLRGDVTPNKATFIITLTACINQVAYAEGKWLHAQIVGMGYESDNMLGNSLVNMYGKCGSPENARRVFDKLPQKNRISWNTMIATYAQHQQINAAFHLFQQMEQMGVVPDRATFIGILEACSGPVALTETKQVHTCIVGCGFDSDYLVGTALVNMYAKCGELETARRLFDRLPELDAVSWTAMITAYAQHGQGKNALQLFRQMQLKGMVPDKVTFISMLDACGNLAALTSGKQIHGSLVHAGFESDVFVGTALVDMYGKCGNVEDSLRVFEKMPVRNVVSWNAIIGAYAQHGQGKVLQFFEQMQKQKLPPNGVTFLSILCACRHSGLVEEGRNYFVCMSRIYSIRPGVEHYNCLIDLLGRAVQLNEGEDLIDTMPCKPTVASLMTLLGACRMHVDVERAERLAARVFRMGSENVAAYVSLANIYSAAGMWNDAAKVRKRIQQRGLTKLPECSSIEVGNMVYEFVAGGELHPQIDKIHTQLKRIIPQMEMLGYVPEPKVVLHNVQEAHVPWYHSEKLAISFGLISTPPGTTLHIINSSRICFDCHSAVKFISKISRRKIIVKDNAHFHQFIDGVCSCGDYC